MGWGGDVKGERDAPAPAPPRSPWFPVPAPGRLRGLTGALARAGAPPSPARARSRRGSGYLRGSPHPVRSHPRLAGSAFCGARVPNSRATAAAAKVLLSYFQGKML